MAIGIYHVSTMISIGTLALISIGAYNKGKPTGCRRVRLQRICIFCQCKLGVP